MFKKITDNLSFNLCLEKYESFDYLIRLPNNQVFSNKINVDLDKPIRNLNQFKKKQYLTLFNK